MLATVRIAYEAAEMTGSTGYTIQPWTTTPSLTGSDLGRFTDPPGCLSLRGLSGTQHICPTDSANWRNATSANASLLSVIRDRLRLWKETSPGSSSKENHQEKNR